MNRTYKILLAAMVGILLAQPGFGQNGSASQIGNNAFDSLNRALRVDAVATGGGGGPSSSFLNLDQLLSSVYDSANNALKVNIVSGLPCTASASGEINCTATGTNQNIRLTPSGTGATIVTNLEAKSGQVFNVKAYGATGNGSTDDTAAFQAALSAAVSSTEGATVIVPSGIYVVSSTLNLSGYGIHVRGVGGASQLIWHGNSTSPFFALQSCDMCSLSNLVLFAVSSSYPLQAFAIQTQASTGPLSSNNVYQNLIIQGGGNMQYGIWVSVNGGTGGNNNTTLVKNDFINGYTTAGVEFDGVNAFNSAIKDSYIIGNGSTSDGVVFATGGESNAASGRIVNTTINSNAIDIFSNGVGGPLDIADVFSQDSAQFLFVGTTNGGTSSSACPVTVRGVTWNGTPTSPIMDFECAGPIVIQGSMFNAGYSNPDELKWNLGSASGMGGSLSLMGDRFQGKLNTAGGIFTQVRPTFIRDTYWQTSNSTGGPLDTPNHSWVNVVPFSSTPSFDISLSNTQKITLSGNVTSSSIAYFNTDASPYYTQTLHFVICQDSAGGHTFAWPSSFHGGMTVGSTASTCSAQSFVYDGTNAYALTLGVVNQ